MEIKEFKGVCLRRLPVMYNGHRYDYIQAYRLYFDNIKKEFGHVVECVQNGGKTVVNAPIEKVEVIRERNW